jgi:hypothetical protein
MAIVMAAQKARSAAFAPEVSAVSLKDGKTVPV